MQVATALQPFTSPQSIAPSVLMTRSPPRIPIGGRIRPGIKVLKKDAKNNPIAAQIYADGLRAGKSFDDIETAIRDKVSTLGNNILIPENVPYFSVFPGDFQNPKVAQQILEKYGEDRGDGVTRLYRFEVVFPADRWELILPHTLKCYTHSELKYWSEFEADGMTRRCMTLAPVAKDPSGTRFVRTWGGRKAVPRPDTDGKCNPEMCPQFQENLCTVTGEFVFYIPGIVGLEAFAVPTRSIYSIKNAMEKLDMIQRGGGRVAGNFGDGVTFRLSKQLKEVSRIDPQDGKAKRVLQELIVLDANVDMVGLLQRPDPQTLHRTGAEHVVILQGPGDVETASTVPAEVRSGGITNSAGVLLPMDQDRRSARIEGDAESPEVTALKRQRTLVKEMVDHIGVTPDEFSKYAIGRWGDAWSRTPTILEAVVRELQNGVAQADGAYQAKIQIHVLLASMKISNGLFGKYAVQKWGADWMKETQAIIFSTTTTPMARSVA